MTGSDQAQAALTRAITAAQIAGPKIRAILNDIAVSPTALGSASRGTNMGTSAKRIGLCIAEIEPNTVAMATVLGSISAMHSPMRLALVPMLVPREALPSAVGLTAMSFNIARILGPAICAAVIARVSAAWAWSLPVIIFAASCLILSSLGGVGTRPKRTHGSVNSEFADGIRYVLGTASLVTILALTSVNGFLGRSCDQEIH